ncbi:sulfotransferase family protein [Nocardiopsis sp. NPDC050513]|uniref:sulfotransferase family protein n=1 Tax=Nocardiopsis sp. NPDC050513 TaxID=3364338 RepID=UPI00379CD1FB
MLQVIGAGFPRTGTSSMKAALERLGFAPCHHMFEVFSSAELARRWAGVAAAPADADWAHVLEGWRSGTDWPLSFFWRELAEAHPDAKVLLTVRDPHRWYASMRETVLRPRRWFENGEVPPGAAHLRDLRPLFDLMWTTHFGHGAEHVPDEATAVAAFERHNAQVEATIPADRLLVYRVGEGWDRLCAFLGVDVPDTPFPHLNDTASFQRFQEQAERGEMPVFPGASTG